MIPFGKIDGGLSEWQGLPRLGGPGCDRLRSSLGAYRVHDDLRRDIRAAVAAEDGYVDDIREALEHCAREIREWEGRARPDWNGWIDPNARERLIALHVRRRYLLTLRDQLPSPS